MFQLHVQSPSQRPPATTRSTPFQKPLHLTSFSYSGNRELLLSSDTKDAALKSYTAPELGSDLNQGFNECVFKKGGDEGIDSLLLALEHYINTAGDDTLGSAEEKGNAVIQAGDLVDRANVITWRGMMSKLLLAVYEVESASNRGGRADGWEMNGMVIDGTLYLEESTPPAKIIAKQASESSYQLQSYYGYAFESYCTASSKANFVPPNTNEQWCSIVKTSLGNNRAIIAGEVDCVRDVRESAKITTDDFIELKTNIIIESERDVMMFERQKLLKHYIQSFLLGVPRIIVGFRTRAGHLNALQTFNTLEIPRLVRGRPHAWDPLVCLANGSEILAFILDSISRAPSTVAYQHRFDATVSSSSSSFVSSSYHDWPVFRITFAPRSDQRRGEGSILIRELSSREIAEEVLGAKVQKARVGFILAEWIEGVRLRRFERERKR